MLQSRRNQRKQCKETSTPSVGDNQSEDQKMAHAEDGQNDGLVLLVDVDLELLHLAFAGQLAGAAVADGRLAHLLLVLPAAALADAPQRLLVPDHQTCKGNALACRDH